MQKRSSLSYSHYVFVTLYIFDKEGRGVDYPPDTSSRITISGAMPPNYSCLFIKCDKENFTFTVP